MTTFYLLEQLVHRNGLPHHLCATRRAPLPCTGISPGGSTACSVCSDASGHISGPWSTTPGILLHLRPTRDESLAFLALSQAFSSPHSSSPRTSTSGSLSSTVVYHRYNCLGPVRAQVCFSQTSLVTYYRCGLLRTLASGPRPATPWLVWWCTMNVMCLGLMSSLTCQWPSLRHPLRPLAKHCGGHRSSHLRPWHGTPICLLLAWHFARGALCLWELADLGPEVWIFKSSYKSQALAGLMLKNKQLCWHAV